jgi:hypothetical protein
MTALPSPPQRLFWLVNRHLDFLQIRDVSGIVKGVSAAIEPLAGYGSVEPVGHRYRAIGGSWRTS